MRGALVVGAITLFVPTVAGRTIGLVIVTGTWIIARQASLGGNEDELSTQ